MFISDRKILSLKRRSFLRKFALLRSNPNEINCLNNFEYNEF